MIFADRFGSARVNAPAPVVVCARNQPTMCSRWEVHQRPVFCESACSIASEIGRWAGNRFSRSANRITSRSPGDSVAGLLFLTVPVSPKKVTSLWLTRRLV